MHAVSPSGQVEDKFGKLWTNIGSENGDCLAVAVPASMDRFVVLVLLLSLLLFGSGC